MIRFLRAPLGSLGNLMDLTNIRQRIAFLPKMPCKVTEIESWATMREWYSDFQLRQKKTGFYPKKLQFGLIFMLFSFFLPLKKWQMSKIFRFWPKMTLLMRTGGVTKIILCGAHFYTYITAPFYAFFRISALMYTFTRGVEVGIPTRVDRFSNLKNCNFFWKKLKNCKYFWKKLKNCKYFWKKLKSCKYFEKKVHLHSGEWRAQTRQFSRSFLKLEKLQSFC